MNEQVYTVEQSPFYVQKHKYINICDTKINILLFSLFVEECLYASVESGVPLCSGGVSLGRMFTSCSAALWDCGAVAVDVVVKLSSSFKVKRGEQGNT